MNISQQILFFLSALGAFNGLVLGIYILYNKRKSIPFLLLGILLLAISIRVAKSVFIYFNPQLPKIYLQVGLSACFLIGPSLYYFFRAAMGRVAAIPANWKREWGVLLGLLVVGGAVFPYQTCPNLWNHFVARLIYLVWAAYIVATGVLLWSTLKTFLVNRSALNATEQFWLWVYGSNCLLYVVYLLALLRYIYGIYIGGGIAFSSILYLTIFFFVKGGKMDQLLTAPELASFNKPEKKKIADNDARAWAEKLGQAIMDKALYKDPNLKLSDLARAINIPAHQLSQLLNDNLGKSFSTYINEYRINEACKLIATKEHLTFEAIGYEVGYNSKSTFYTAFKKVTDTTPALFKENAMKTTD
ncbi:helix-turn-helix domain-containing protein [Chitinophaga filiformis]|uniref:Helix-turn-helix domain-containing protein n=1 Tax=Chitinophaga filiformis TaxID=104663 RepID=A0ABY4HYY5_CHIFI|nr:helix-turn-helix transcriptional regulator [Chitinophaga filiformis]UPK69048.1 helix-turn-helix domain-containing protein [Chitinophaga filiformis]